MLTGGGFWPAWVMLGWGFNLAWQTVQAFTPEDNKYEHCLQVEKEIRRHRGR